MTDGVVQQVDTPQNLYDNPCNKFVAGFIGAPQMNMIDAAVAKSGSQVTLSFGGHTIALPDVKGKRLEEAGYVGKTVTLGIRPGYVSQQRDRGDHPRIRDAGLRSSALLRCGRCQLHRKGKSPHHRKTGRSCKAGSGYGEGSHLRQGFREGNPELRAT